MSDHEGFEMLDETFGVREASDSSDADSPHPRKLGPQISSLLQQHPQPSSMPTGCLNDHAHHLGRVGMETGGESPKKQAVNMAGDGMTVISPQPDAKGCQGGTVPGKGAVLKVPDAGAEWDRFRLTAPATGRHREGSSTLAESSPPKDPRPPSVKAKNDSSDGCGGNQRIGRIQSNINNSLVSTTPTAVVGTRLGTPGEQRGEVEKRAGFSTSDISFDASAVVLTSKPNAVNCAVDRRLMAAPAAQIQQPDPLGRSGGKSVARARGSALVATLPPPSSEGGHGSRNKGFIFATAPGGAPAPPPPPFGNFPNASTATSRNTDVSPLCNLHRTSPAVEVPFNPRAAAPLLPTPSSASGLAQRQGERLVARSAAADPCQLASPFGPQPSPVTPVVGFGDESRKSGGCATAATGSPSPLSEDEAATMELVGMGFDREHVVRALTECGRGESWKEAAISLLLEPQMSTMSSHFEAPLQANGDPESGLSGGERPAADGPR